MPSSALQLEYALKDGFLMQYLIDGSGEPIVFVHGSNADHRIWSTHQSIISRTHKFVGITQRYFGTGPWPDDGAKFSMQQHADDIADFIEGMGLAPATIVGWSTGAGACLTMAAQSPGLAKRMFLYEPAIATFVEDPIDSKRALDDRFAMSAVARSYAEKDDRPNTVRHFMDGVNNEAGTFELLPDRIQEVMTENARMLPLLFAGPPMPFVTADDLRKLEVPITVALGSDTRAFYTIAAEHCRQLLPKCTSVTIDGARHLWPVQNPSEFCRQISAFLDA